MSDSEVASLVSLAPMSTLQEKKWRKVAMALFLEDL